MANESAVNDEYLLGRGYAAATRLNLQHYLWVKAFDGQLLLPNIPHESEGLKIAEIATGTGIWLLDLAEQAHRSTHFDGFDISLAQTPPKDWVPSNVNFRQYDVLTAPPDDLLEKYDIVHVRHLSYIVRNNDPTSVLQNLLKMLKPGGYIQWGEHDTIGRKTLTTTSGPSTTGLDKLKDRMYDFLHTPNTTWPAELDSFFLKQGMQDITLQTKWTNNAYARTHQEVAIMVYEELLQMITSKPATTAEEGEELRQLFKEAVKESEDGAAWNIAKIYVTGRKPI